MAIDDFCRDCVFYRGSMVCANAKADPFSRVVDGHPSRDVVSYGGVNAGMCRLTEAMCGPEAKWFEARDAH